ncbi:hypothetical protein GWI33_003935, partial [Rhynchophorus ferrugineus]
MLKDYMVPHNGPDIEYGCVFVEFVFFRSLLRPSGEMEIYQFSDFRSPQPPPSLPQPQLDCRLIR